MTASASIGVGDTTVPGRIESARQGVGPGGERRGGALGDRPLAVGRDADRGDAVLRRIDGAQHVGGRRARHVVFGRLPAEDHDEMDPIVGHPVAVPSWSIGRTVPFDVVRILASDAAAAVRRAPDRTRRRVRRGVVRLPLDRSRASCSCRSWPSATATTSSTRRAAAGAVAHLTSRPVDSGDGGTAIEVGRHVRSR